jgi:hypothetical protein
LGVDRDYPGDAAVVLSLRYRVGEWALWVLSRPEVKAAFALNLRRNQKSLRSDGTHAVGAGERKPTGLIYGMVKSAIGAMLTLIVHRPTASKASPLAEAGPKKEDQGSG